VYQWQKAVQLQGRAIAALFCGMIHQYKILPGYNRQILWFTLMALRQVILLITQNGKMYFTTNVRQTFVEPLNTLTLNREVMQLCRRFCQMLLQLLMIQLIKS